LNTGHDDAAETKETVTPYSEKSVLVSGNKEIQEAQEPYTKKILLRHNDDLRHDELRSQKSDEEGVLKPSSENETEVALSQFTFENFKGNSSLNSEDREMDAESLDALFSLGGPGAFQETSRDNSANDEVIDDTYHDIENILAEETDLSLKMNDFQDIGTSFGSSNTVNDAPVVLAVDPTNDHSVVVGGISDTNIKAGYDVSRGFNDVEIATNGDQLTYSATLDNGGPLPSWMSIDQDTGFLNSGAVDGSDTLFGGEGTDIIGDDDTIVFDHNDILVDGGIGIDTLLIDDTSLNLDFVNYDTSNINNFEKISFGDEVNTTLSLDLGAVVDITEAQNTLYIDAETGSDNQIDLDSGWSVIETINIEGITYDHYSQGGADLYIDTDVVVVTP